MQPKRQSKHLKQVIRKTMKKAMTNYILKKGDICCEKDIDRKLVIEDILKLYTEIADFMFEKEQYLDYVQNDLLVFIGYRMMLEEGKNTEGVGLWDSLKKRTEKGIIPNKEKIMELLHQVPLFYLMSFLGYAQYKNSRNQAILALNKNALNKK